MKDDTVSKIMDRLERMPAAQRSVIVNAMLAEQSGDPGQIAVTNAILSLQPGDLELL